MEGNLVVSGGRPYNAAGRLAGLLERGKYCNIVERPCNDADKTFIKL